MSSATLGNAIAFAAFAHRNQIDKAGLPYILHPLAVMNHISQYPETYQVVAVLHDVAEDTGFDVTVIERRFGAVVADAVEALTHRPNEKYEAYIERVKKNEIAKVVKHADLHHNLYGRLIKDPRFAKKHAQYEAALKALAA